MLLYKKLLHFIITYQVSMFFFFFLSQQAFATESFTMPVIGKVIQKLEERDGLKFLLKNDSTHVTAPIEGQIYYVGQIKDFGQTIIIKNPHTMVTIGQLSHVRVVKNQYVFQGDLVASTELYHNVLFSVHPVRSFLHRYVTSLKESAYHFSAKVMSYVHFRTLLENKGFPREDIPIMYCIAKWESSLNPKALNFNSNNTVDVGLFQINSSWFHKCHVSFADLYDEERNAECAFMVYKSQGFFGWTSFHHHRNHCQI